MNSSSRRIGLAGVLALALLVPGRAAALNVYGVYVTACERYVGVILSVDRSRVTLVTLNGDVVEVPRYEILSLAYYPTVALPAPVLRVGDKVSSIEVNTLQDGEVKRLAVGFPVDFSAEKIAFMTWSGEESLVDRDSIWSLTTQLTPPELPLHNPESARTYRFMHPYAAGFCQEESAPSKALLAYPQQYLNDEVVIKKELDRRQQGYEEVDEYLRDQKFYPVPQLYRNETSLGLWTTYGSRHGASKSRLNNLTPILVDDLTLGPFRYQHTFLTGSAPMLFAPHEEPQTQVYYRFKAAYFHLSAMFDPSLILVGSRYHWREQDLDAGTPDDRANDSFFLELGFDFWNIALQFSPGSVTHVAVRDGNHFQAVVLGVTRGGLRYEDRHTLAEFWYGHAFGNVDWNFDLWRFNWTWKGDPLRLTGSVIAKGVDFSAQESENVRFDYHGDTYVAALYADWAFSNKYSVGAFASAEYHSRDAQVTGGTTRHEEDTHPKAGLLVALRF